MATVLFTPREDLLTGEQTEKFDILRLDLIDTLEQTGSSIITDSPIESGRVANDGAISLPDEFVLTAIVSPLAVRDEEGNFIQTPSDITRLFFADETAAEDASFEATLKITEVFNHLQELKNTQTLLELVDEVTATGNLVIQDLRRVQDRNTGTSLVVEMTLKQVRVIEQQFGLITKEKTTGEENPAADMTSEQNNGGGRLIEYKTPRGIIIGTERPLF